MDYGYMQATGSDPTSDDERGNPQYDREQAQTGQIFPGFDMSTVDPNMLSVNQNMIEPPVAQFAFPPPQHVYDGSWTRAANSQLGPRDASTHQLSNNTAPPFASRQTTIPRRETRSETSAGANIQARLNNGSVVPSPYSRQLIASPTFQSHDIQSHESTSLQMAAGFSLLSPYSSLSEQPHSVTHTKTSFISQGQSQPESLGSLSRKRTRGEDHGCADVEHNNGHSMIQPHSSSPESISLEQTRLDFIRYWLDAFPHASLFNRTQMESLAALMTVPVEVVEHLCNKLIRSQPNHFVGPPGNASTSLQAESPLSASLLQRSVLQDTLSTSEFAALVQWIERRGPQCKPISDHSQLTRKGSKIYQCTRACGSAFARKEDWVRHELCKNYPQEGWVCNLPSALSVNGVLICSSCGVHNPGMSHSDPPYTPCQDWKTFKGRVFFREDHFLSHFRKFHHHSISAREQLAKAHFRVDSQYPRECGFCNTNQFESWESRAHHLAHHFKVDGKDMKDWKTTHAGVLHRSGDDDDDDDGYDDEGGDDNEPGEDRDENNGEGAGNDNYQSYGGTSKQPPNDSNYGHSGRSRAPSGNKNSWGNSYQYKSQSSAFPGRPPIDAHRREGGKYLAPTNEKEGKLKTTSSRLQASSTLPPQRPAQQSDIHDFQGLSFSTNQSILPVDEAANRTGYAKFSSESSSAYVSESECRERYCQKPTHHHFKGRLKSFTNSIKRKLQAFGTKEVVHNYTIDELDRTSPATAERAALSNETMFTVLNPDEISYRATSTFASSSTLKVSYLEQKLLDTQIPWGTHWFIPVDALGKIVTEQAINEELNRITDLPSSDISLTSHKIWAHARKTFAILLSIGKGRWISSFLNEGITDRSLPINIPKGASQQKEWIAPIKTFGGWPSRELDDFRRVQWYFLAPIFTSAITQHYELDDNCVMPFIKDTEHEARSGGFSDVWEVVIHPAHQKLFDSKKNPPVALKRLHSRQYDDFKHEVDMLTALAQKKHNHIIKLLATYKFRGQYHLMFPFANSNLRQYWEQNEPCLSHENLNWSLNQMHGLASALCTIHNFRSASPNNRSVYTTSQPDQFLATRKILSSGDEGKYGRHGDLKPENILWFDTTECTSGSLGTLQIADLGLGAFHRLGSRSNVGARSVGGSQTYLPPECALDLPISRAYDLWSLGCIFLEFVVWLLDGPKGLEKFANDRLFKGPDGVYDDSFFRVALRSDTGKYASDVRPSVREWICDLHIRHRGSTFIRDLLDLISQEMLVVRPQGRITSRRLSQKLKEFATKATIDEDYLLQKLVVAKRENEKHCRVNPGLLDWHLTIERIVSIPTRKTISWEASDSSVQQLGAYAASVVTECTSVYVSATWSLSRESDADLNQSSTLELELASGLNDPILEHFASRKLTAAPTAAPIRKTAYLNSPISSIDGSDSDETSSSNLELEPALVLGSSVNSEASQGEDTFDQEHHDGHEAWIWNGDSSLFGLELPREFHDQPILCNATYENYANICDVNYEVLNEFLNLQTRADARPWIIGAENFPPADLEEPALAPCPGPAYNEYYLTIRNYTRRYHKIKKMNRRTSWRSCKSQNKPLESCDEPAAEAPEFEKDICLDVLSQWSSTCTKTRDKQSQDCHNKNFKRFPGTMEPLKIPLSLDCASLPLETLVSIFHPSFLVAHLSRSSVSLLTTDLYAPKDLFHDHEYSVGFSLGFGPPINLDVCIFTPRDKNALRRYRTRGCNYDLGIQKTLPIALNLFSVESHAEELDVWLDGIIDSESGLREYIVLMKLWEKNHQILQFLNTLISWYIGSKNNLSRTAHRILRPALKLLITITLLGLVTKVTELPKSLSYSLCLQYPDQTIADLSTDAPRLLTRQMKAAIYCLQQHFLRALFCHFVYAMKLDGDVKIAVAFLVAYTLDLVRAAGRDFARYVTMFNPSVVVSNQEVTEYETHLQAELFDRIRASIADVKGKSGGLVTRLRNLDLSVKGKEKRSEEHEFVSAILEIVL